VNAAPAKARGGGVGDPTVGLLRSVAVLRWIGDLQENRAPTWCRTCARHSCATGGATVLTRHRRCPSGVEIKIE